MSIRRLVGIAGDCCRGGCLVDYIVLFAFVTMHGAVRNNTAMSRPCTPTWRDTTCGEGDVLGDSYPCSISLTLYLAHDSCTMYTPFHLSFFRLPYIILVFASSPSLFLLPPSSILLLWRTHHRDRFGGPAARLFLHDELGRGPQRPLPPKEGDGSVKNGGDGGNGGGDRGYDKY